MSAEIYVKRLFWLVPVTVVALAAYLVARTTNELIEAKFLIRKAPAPRASELVSGPGDVTLPRQRDKDFRPTVIRNVFCSTCPEWAPPPPPDAGVPTPPKSDPNNPEKSGLPLVLVSTQLSYVRWAENTAIIRDTTTNATDIYKFKDVLPGGATVYEVQRGRVIVENAGRYEYIAMDGVTIAATTVVEPPVTDVGAPMVGDPPDSIDDALDKGIRKVSDTEYEIQRGLMDRILADTSVLPRHARIVPSMVNGKSNGFKLYAIRPSGVYAKIGMVNGDTVQAINGYELTSVIAGLEAYNKLKNASNFSVTVLRHGEAVTMNYTIR